MNYAAAHPEQVLALYLDAPVLDLWSWPGGGKTPQQWLQAKPLYGITNETPRAGFAANPIEKAEALGRAKLPIIAVCGDADDLVPMVDNILAFQKRFAAAGGQLKLITKPGVGHHPHSLPDPTPIVEFLLALKP